jgi:hypothetical protein
MSGWLDWIFGNRPDYDDDPVRGGDQSNRLPLTRKAQPVYQAMPTSPNIDDRRPNTLSDAIQNSTWQPEIWPGTKYQASPLGGQEPSVEPRMAFNMANNTAIPMSPGDPILDTANRLAATYPPNTSGYKPSFPQNMRTPRQTQLPYFPSPNGPNLQSGWRPGGNPDLPYISPHLPISPGDPGWTSPPSPSGPHNPQGDPARPGYDFSGVSPLGVAPGMTINSVQPWMRYRQD